MCKKDITGQLFGRLTAVSYVPGNGTSNRAKWLCQCDCGNTTYETYSNLYGGRTVSCGCKRKEQAGTMNTSHRLSDTRIYRIWSNMLSRTSNPNVPCYVWYGGRGIRVCDSWKNDFINFYQWAMASGYSNDLTIDRINVDGIYEPANCRWVDMKTQASNRRRRVTV